MPEPEESRGGDRILTVTRIVALAIVPFLAVAAFLLLVFPDRTGELFAWAIAPPLSAALLAAAYIGGIRYFVGTVTAPRWHHVRHGVPAVVVFAAGLLVATLLHLDRFSANLSFLAWIALYATTPFVVAALGWVQRRSDPGTPDVVDVRLDQPTRLVLVAVGAAALLAGIALFVAPDAIAPLWAWDLTALTGQVTGAVLSLTGVVNLAMLRDARWSSFRILYQSQLVSLAVILVSLVVHQGDLRWDRPATSGFVGLVILAALLYGGVTVRAERQLSRARLSAAP